jgi:hypothetical protein
MCRGYCSRHYSRWQKHGDPVAGRTREGAVLEWLRQHVGYESEDCLIFPFARKKTGYGAVKFRGHIIAASRAMCFLAHGDPVDERLVAAHSCGHGHLGCVNPKHLRWATSKENAADFAEHLKQGVVERAVRRKVSAEQVGEIRRLRGAEYMHVTAKRYGISESMVCRIQRGNRRSVA